MLLQYNGASVSGPKHSNSISLLVLNKEPAVFYEVTCSLCVSLKVGFPSSSFLIFMFYESQFGTTGRGCVCCNVILGG